MISTDDHAAPPKVSIIIPVYNGREYLTKCLDSVLAQSYKSFETIIVNDGSTDDTAEICNEYALGDHRIAVMHVENGGPAAARNHGIEKSQGEFIFFLDADDFLEPDSLHALMDAQKQYQADLVVGDFNRIRDDKVEAQCNVLMPESRLLSKPEIIEQAGNYLKKPNRHLLFAYSWGRLFRASIIKDHGIGFNTELKTYEDVAFNFECLKYIETMYFIKKSVYNHLIHAGFASATMTVGGDPDRMFGYITALAKAREFMNACNVDMNQEIGQAYITLTIIQLVRVCGQMNDSNRQMIYALIRKVINNPTIRSSLSYYAPGKGESKMVPLLMKLKMVKLIAVVCRHKAHKRYVKKGIAK